MTSLFSLKKQHVQQLGFLCPKARASMRSKLDGDKLAFIDDGGDPSPLDPGSQRAFKPHPSLDEPLPDGEVLDVKDPDNNAFVAPSLKTRAACSVCYAVQEALDGIAGPVPKNASAFSARPRNRSALFFRLTTCCRLRLTSGLMAKMPRTPRSEERRIRCC